MCTLILGQNVLGAGTALIATNRDEDPKRESGGPGMLHGSPRVVGGKDIRAGGTWLAIRDGKAAAALLNRRSDPDQTSQDFRSRGLLTLEVAGVDELSPPAPMGIGVPSGVGGGRLGRAAANAAMEQLERFRYAPFSLVWASGEGSWVLSYGGSWSSVDAIAPGWHVIAHDDVDDREEPRVAWLLDQLAGWAPRDFDEARPKLEKLLASHGEGGAPPVCLHGGPADTVSAALVLLGAGGPRYLHAAGPPCREKFQDFTELLR